MNVFFLTDLEGISGVTNISYMNRTSSEYQEARKYLTDTINKAIDICKECEVDNIYYLDGHGGGGNVIEDQVDKSANKVDINGWETLLKNGEIDCQIELGLHARAGTIGGFLDHTINSSQWFSYRINGREYGELGMHAILCGKYNVPIIACSGDKTACIQAKEYIPEIYTIPVKEAVCRNIAESFEDSDEVFRKTLADAIKNYKNVSPVKVAEPLEIELTFYRTDMCEEVLQHCEKDVIRVDARTLKKVVYNVEKYGDLMFH